MEATQPQEARAIVPAENPFGKVIARPTFAGGAVATSDQQRAITEVQAAIFLAKQFPRDVVKATDEIINACTRPGLAEKALYSYPRGGQQIEGPSVYLARVIAQAWGNIQIGVRELEQKDGSSVMEAFAWDCETNTRSTRTFTVKHGYKAKGAYKTLEDPRDIYEKTANDGARRMRACIFEIIPGDVVEVAVDQTRKTLTAHADTSPANLKKMLEVFGEYGVTKEQIEKFIARRYESILPAQLIRLRGVYNSLKDGMSVAADWFEVAPPAEGEEPENMTDAIKAKMRGKKEEAPAPAPTTTDNTLPLE